LLGHAFVSAAWLTAGFGPDVYGLAFLALGLGTASIGAMAGSQVPLSIVENNSPPSPETQMFVRDRHRAAIGRDLPGNVLKRAFDILIAGASLALAVPAGWLMALLLWWQDPGPILFVKNSVGLRGRNFRQLKFRTMVWGAEDQTGPVWAAEQDSRVLGIGRFLRKTALDELPQLWNILCGDMSFVGPRPQRTVLVATYLERMPQYALRHVVRPGLSGLAQVAGHYYLTPRQKLRYDLLYVNDATVCFDFRLLAIAFLLVFWLRWSPNWGGRLPRSWLHRARRIRMALSASRSRPEPTPANPTKEEVR
jgi:lipopolysaccharide/colanic/teichoic acid biosynthesis glycosyltransferase